MSSLAQTSLTEDGYLLINGHSNVCFICGLEWELIYFNTSAEKSRKIKHKVLSKYSKPNICFSGETKDSTSVGVFNGDAKKNANSFAGALANLYKTGVYLLEAEGKCWLFYFEDGVILPNIGERKFDSQDECRDYIINSLFPVIDDDIEFYGERFLAPSEIDSGERRHRFNDIDLVTTLTALRDERCTFRRKYVPLSQLAAIGISSIIFLVLGYLAIDIYADSKMEALKSKQEISKQQSILNRINKERDKFFSSILSFGKQIPPRVFVETINTTIGDIPVSYKGWGIEVIRCTSELSVCSFKWRSVEHGTYIEFFERFSKYRIDFHPNGKEILMEVDIKFPKLNVTDGEEIYAKLPTKMVFNNTHISNIQYLQKSEIIDFSVDKDKSELDAPSEIASSWKDKTLGVIAREWQISGKGYYYLIDVTKYLPEISFTVKELSITFSNAKTSEANWIMSGTYVHKNS